MGGVEGADMSHGYVSEVRGAGQQEVGGSSLVCALVIVLVTRTARQEKPALETLAPCCRFMDQVA